MAIKSEAAKERKRIKSREYARAHREERRVYQRAYYAAHRVESQLYRDSRKEKQRELARKNYLVHKEEKLAATQFLRDENPEHFREISRKSYQAHRLKTIARTTKYLQEHPDILLKSQRNYRKNHPEKSAEQDLKRRVLEYNSKGSHTHQQWLARVELYGWKCFYCPKKLDNKTLTKDHRIPLNKGGSNWASNLVPACKSCNSSKQDKKPNEFKGRKAA
jgi:5-methylcytosine-specific restriction endonuclease McrA